MLEWMLLPLFGVLAGSLTTVAGLGGGLLLVLGLSLWWGPGPALAATALALLVGNVHRASLFRRDIDRRVALAFSAGAVPGALIGAIFAVTVPERWVHAVMVLVTLLAVLRASGKLHWEPKSSQLAPGGAVVGLLTGAAGGAGVLAGPILLASGLSGRAYIATTSTIASAMHLARLFGYGYGGAITPAVVARAAVLAAAIMFGNWLGRWLRRWTERAPPSLIETATLVVCVVLSVAGVAR